MPFLFSHPKKRAYGCTVLVCENAISFLVYEIIDSTQAKISYIKSARTSFHKKGTSHQVGAAISANVYRLLHDFNQEMHKKEHSDFFLQQVAFFYAPPLAFAATEEVELINEKGIELTDQALSTLLHGAEESFLKRFKESGVRVSDLASRYTVIERRIANPKLEGYPVGEYIGRPFKHFSALISFTAVPTYLVQKLTDVIHSVFRKAIVSHKSVVYSTLDELSIFQKNPTLLLSALLPDNSLLAYFQNNAPLSHSIFDGGEEHLLGYIARALSVTKTIARSYAILYEEKKLHAESEAHFLKALKKAKEQWAKEMVVAYKTMGDLFVLPKVVTVVPSGNIGALVFKKSEDVSVSTQTYLFNILTQEQYPHITHIEHLAPSPLEVLLVNHSLAHRLP